jgi:DNA-binding transcriptional LysR family regulator
VIERALRQANLQVRETMRLDWLEAIEAMVHHGHGIAVVPERRTPGQALFKVKRVPLGPKNPRRMLGLVEPDGSPKRRLTDALFDELIAVTTRRGTQPRGRNASSSPARAKRKSR